MAQVIVAVPDPYETPSAPLLPGMYVDVEIEGREVSGVRMIPRDALRAGNVVWAAGGEGVLRIRNVNVLRSRPDSVVARVALGPDERIITSHLSEVTDGMRVRTAEGSR
jgi:multidrug efflux pump subunit AcrA (membrane-fusion protein)